MEIKNLWKRLLSLVLCLCMVLSLLPRVNLTAKAADGDPCTAAECGGVYENGFCTTCDGYEEAVLNAEGWYEISNAGQLYWFAALVNAKYQNAYKARLTTDITDNPGTFDAQGNYIATEQGESPREWTPIGLGVNYGFGGTFDGGGHTVSGLYINDSVSYSAGFFGTVLSAGVVQNVRVINTCFLKGTIWGGIAAWNMGGTLIGCGFEGSITTPKGEAIGGVAGINEGAVINCYSSGSVGILDGIFIGGVVGDNREGGIIANCYNVGTVSGNTLVGSVAGRNNGTITSCFYLTGCATDEYSKIQQGIGTSVGNSSLDDVEGSTCGKTGEQFQSGEVAYLLQNGENGQIWGQNIGTDPYPNFTGSPVYLVKDCDGVADAYSNTNENRPHTFGEGSNGFCTVCNSGYEPATLNSDGYYEIGNAGQLYWFAALVNAKFKNAYKARLTTDITDNPGTFDAQGNYIATEQGESPREWTPIGLGVNYGFGGTFDGGGHTVSGLYTNDSGSNSAGFFGTVLSTGVVQNVRVINTCFLQGVPRGGIAAWNMGGTLIGCGFEGSITSPEGATVGGVTGINEGAVINCYSSGSVRVLDGADIGGVVGDNREGGIIANCYNVGTVSGNTWVGSVAGRNNGTITNCFYLTGCATDDTSKIQQGIGTNVGNSSLDDVEGSTCGKTGEQFQSGEVAYLLQNGENGQIWGQNIGTDPYPNFTGSPVYLVKNCDGVADVYSNTNENRTHTFGEGSNGFCTGCNSGYEPATLNSDGYYEIGNAGQLYWFADFVDQGNTSANAILTADITVNENVVVEMSKETPDASGFRVWNPIGTRGKRYTGIFDGKNHTISGLYFDNSEETYEYIALIAWVDSTVQNVHVSDTYFRSGANVAGIAGLIYADNSMISGCSFDGILFGKNTGGIVGSNGGGTTANNLVIKNCTNYGMVTSTEFGYYAGGIAPCNYSIITDCSNEGTVIGYNAGGIAASNSTAGKSLIENCYNLGDVQSTHSNVGMVAGIAGSNNGRIINCYTAGNVTESNEYGGITGKNWSDATVSGCYYDSTVFAGAAIGNNMGAVDEATCGKPTEAFASGEVAYLLQNAQTADETTGEVPQVWGQNIDNGEEKQDYPVFSGVKVYSGYKTCDDTIGVQYSNDPDKLMAEKPEHTYEQGICMGCQSLIAAEQNADGFYEIGNAGQLFWFAALVNTGYNDIPQNKAANAVLIADINLENRQWTPIGSTGLYYLTDRVVEGENGYEGIFDGQGHTVSNITVTGSTEVEQTYGLFGTLSGSVSNLGVDKLTFVLPDGGKDLRVGGIAGQILAGGTVANCFVTNSNMDIGTYVTGGIAACNYGGTVLNCYAYGNTISGTVGSNNEYRYGHIVGDNRADGSATDRPGKVINCYTDGAVAMGSRGGTINEAATKTAEAFLSGEVTYLLNGDQSAIAWYQTCGTGLPAFSGKTVYKNLDCQLNVNYANESVVMNHNYEGNNGFCKNVLHDGTVCDHYEPAQQNAEGYYEIGNAGQLYWFAEQVNNDYANFGSANAVLIADLQINVSTAIADNPRQWTPIGTLDAPYNGTFNGNKHTITKLCFTQGQKGMGLIGGLGQGGVVELLGMIDPWISSGPGTYVGGIVGKNLGTVRNCFVRGGEVVSAQHVGGLVGWNEGTVTNCYAVTETRGGNNISPLVGYNYNGTVEHVYCCKSVLISLSSGTCLLEAQFASGEAAWLLNSNQSIPVWYQTCGQGMPAFSGKTVYQVGKCGGGVTYRNDRNEQGHNYDAEGFCSNVYDGITCGAYEPAMLKEGAYQIAKSGNLFWLAQEVSAGRISGASVLLTGDVTIPADKTWTPISNGVTLLDGGFHTITIHQDTSATATTGNYGLFADFGYAQAQNLILKGSIKVNTTGSVGAIAGSSFATGLNKIVSYVSVTNLGTGSTGGLMGYYGGKTASVINNCAVYGNIQSGGDAGGLIGRGWGGTQYYRIYNSAYVGSVVGGTYAGAFVGYNATGQGSSNPPVSMGNIQFVNSYYCVPAADVGIVGGSYQHNGTGVEGYATITNVEAKTEEQFASGEVTYLLNGGQSSIVWYQTCGEGLPAHSGKQVYYGYDSCAEDAEMKYTNNNWAAEERLPHAEFDNGFCKVCDAYQPAEPDDQGVYQISNAGQLYWFAQYVNSETLLSGGDTETEEDDVYSTSVNGKLVADIVVNQNVLKQDGSLNGDGSNYRIWTPIGDSRSDSFKDDIYYTGIFDGNHKTISGLYTDKDQRQSGLFGLVSHGEVKDLGLLDSWLVLGSESGGIVGTLSQGKVTGCYNASTILYKFGALWFGGVVGKNYYGVVADCYNTGKVSGLSYVGGVVGYSVSGEVTNCYNTGSVSGVSSEIGGVVGSCTGNSTVSLCYNTASVFTDDEYAGGVVGSAESGTSVINCYNTGNITAEYTYTTAAGVVGNAESGVTITNCYNVGVAYTAICAGSATISNCYRLDRNDDGTSAALFASGEICYLLQGQQSQHIWGQNLGTDPYPTLGGPKVYAVRNCKAEILGYSNTEDLTNHHSYGDDGICIYCGEREPLSGWNQLEGNWYYFNPDTHTATTGIARVPYPTEPIGGITYAPNAVDANGDPAYGFTDLETSMFVFDENGVFQSGLNGRVMDGETMHWAVNGQLPWHVGLVQEGEDYYYFIGENRMVTGNLYVGRNTTELEVVLGGVYTFAADGKLCKYQGITDVNGVLYYYEDYRLALDAGLIKVGENYYYVRETGELVVGQRYWVEKMNQYTEIQPGGYDFDENGVMRIPEPKKDGIVEENGILYYYEDGYLGSCGLIQYTDGDAYNGDWIYVRSNGQLAVGQYWATNVNDSGYEQGFYTFDRFGRMEAPKNGIVEEDGKLYYYIEGVMQYGLGLMKLEDGSYIYVRSNGQLAVGLYWVTQNNELLPKAFYHFGEDGRLVFQQ